MGGVPLPIAVVLRVVVVGKSFSQSSRSAAFAFAALPPNASLRPGSPPPNTVCAPWPLFQMPICALRPLFQVQFVPRCPPSKCQSATWIATALEIRGLLFLAGNTEEEAWGFPSFFLDCILSLCSKYFYASE